MKKLLGILILGLLIASPAFAFNEFMTKQQKRFKNSELVKIPSYRAFDFYSIQEGWYKESPSEVGIFTNSLFLNLFCCLVMNSLHSCGAWNAIRYAAFKKELFGGTIRIKRNGSPK